MSTMLMNDFFNKQSNKKKILDSQYKRFHKKFGNEKFSEIVEKIITKYESEEYKCRWLNRGIEPQESLYFFLFYFAKWYGRITDNDDWEEYANSFTFDLSYYGGYYFNLMHGQSSCILITKAR